MLFFLSFSCEYKVEVSLKRNEHRYGELRTVFRHHHAGFLHLVNKRPIYEE